MHQGGFRQLKQRWQGVTGALGRGLARLDALSLPGGLAVGVGAGALLCAGLWWPGGWAAYGLAACVMGGALALGVTGRPVGGVVQRILDLVDLPGGVFLMGSPESEVGRSVDEGPRHRVQVSPFSVSRTPVTQGQYQAVMGENPGEPKGDDLPVNNVSYFDAVKFCNALSRREGLRPCYQIAGETVRCDPAAGGYRLPTEAEWEYAARAGSETAYPFGDDPAQLGLYAWYIENADGIRPVGQLRANAFGLHDMLGNVWEWVEDWYQSDIYKVRQQGDKVAVNPMTRGSSSGPRVLRGGSFDDVPRFLRSAYRSRTWPEVGVRGIGFRCAWSPVRQPRPLFPWTLLRRAKRAAASDPD